VYYNYSPHPVLNTFIQKIINEFSPSCSNQDDAYSCYQKMDRFFKDNFPKYLPGREEEEEPNPEFQDLRDYFTEKNSPNELDEFMIRVETDKFILHFDWSNYESIPDFSGFQMK